MRDQGDAAVRKTATTSRVTAAMPPTEEAATTPCVTAAKPLCEREAIALSVIAAARTQGEIAAMWERGGAKGLCEYGGKGGGVVGFSSPFVVFQATNTAAAVAAVAAVAPDAAAAAAAAAAIAAASSTITLTSTPDAIIGVNFFSDRSPTDFGQFDISFIK